MKKNKKIRVNITVDRALLKRAKSKLGLFGGKLSTLFNAYLSDFVDSMSYTPTNINKSLLELERRVSKLENIK